MADAKAAELVGVASFEQVDADTDRVIANFQTAVSGGNAQQIVVQLGHLEQYYQRLYETYDRVEQLSATTSKRVAQAQDHVLTAYVGDGPIPRIEGVESALQTSMHVATRSRNGLSESLESVLRMLRKNLSDLYDSYAAYVRTDDVAAEQLRAAGQPLDALDGWSLQ